MSSVRLLWESLLYYWRTNLAVLLGVIAGTAVIGGALIVGDSVRGSLETMSRERLGEIDYALSSHRFVRENLAKGLADHVKPSDATPELRIENLPQNLGGPGPGDGRSRRAKAGDER